VLIFRISGEKKLAYRLNSYYDLKYLNLYLKLELTLCKIKTALLSYGMSGKISRTFLELHPGFELLALGNTKN
jgi:hypothetical protein